MGGTSAAEAWRKVGVGNSAPKADEPPPPVPDLTDETIKAARSAARRRLMMGQGLSQSFLTGPLGDPRI